MRKIILALLSIILLANLSLANTTCPEGLLILRVEGQPDQCVESCPTGTAHILNQPTLCIPCKYPCVTCENYTNWCTSCAQDTVLDAPRKRCKTCPERCATCDENNDCVDCKEEYFNIITEYNNNTSIWCFESCFSGFYLVNERDCVKCHRSCHTCSNGNTCDTCVNGQVLSVNGLCVTCDERCNSCDDNGACVECSAGHSLINGQCVPSCPEGSYYNNETLSCQVCSTECGTCVRSADNCLSCNPIGHFQDYQGQCQSCREGCETCINDRECLSCPSELILYKDPRSYDVCVKECPFRWFGQPGGECQFCRVRNCNACSSSNTCDVCREGYYLDDNRQCQRCSSACKTCSGESHNQCTSCYSPRYLTTFLDGRLQCRYYCPSNFRQEGSECFEVSN